jgi:hypothetical protein
VHILIIKIEQIYKLLFDNNLELRIKKENYDLTQGLNPWPLAWETSTQPTELTTPVVTVVVYECFVIPSFDG